MNNNPVMLLELLDSVRKHAYPDKPVIVNLPACDVGYFVGDLHGDIDALEKILEIIDFEARALNGESICMVFLGDYIDRGKHSIEVLIRVFNLLLSFPNQIFVLRGNHETDFPLNYFFGFRKEINAKYGKKIGELIYQRFHETFEHLPLIAYGDDSGIIATHGALPREGLIYAGMSYFAQALIESHRLRQSVLWSDVNQKQRNGNGSRSLHRLFLGGKYSIREIELTLAEIGATFMFRGHSHTIRGVHAVSQNIATIISANALAHFGTWIGRRGQRGFAEVSLNTPLISIEQINVRLF